MTYGEIQQVVQDRLGIGPSDPISIRRVNDALNESHREILTMKGLGSRLRQITVPFTTVANSPIAAMPSSLKSISIITDRLNRRVYTEMFMKEVRQRDPGAAFSTSAPFGYVILSMASAVAKDPSAASELFVVSDSASDGGGTNVHVEGVTSDGSTRRATATMGGLTPISVGSAITDWIAVTKFFLTASAAGHATLTQGSGGTELARISPGRSYARYTRLSIYPTPTSALTLYADGESRVVDMIDSYDEPLIPEDFHWLLVCGALKKEYLRKERFPQYDREDGRWRKGINDLRADMNTPSGPARSARSQAFSQLGPDFPAGS